MAKKLENAYFSRDFVLDLSKKDNIIQSYKYRGVRVPVCSISPIYNQNKEGEEEKA